MERHCEVIVRTDAIFVFGNAETQPGVRITAQPVTKLSANVDAENLGRAVLATLDAYRVGVKHPTREQWEASEQDSLRGTGFGSWRKLSKGALRLGIKAEGSSVVVTPTATDGRGGYADIVAMAVTSTSDPRQIGEAVRNALQRCETKSKLP
jgi:hypothetical protein